MQLELRGQLPNEGGGERRFRIAPRGDVHLEKDVLLDVLNEDGGCVALLRRVGPLPYGESVGILERKAVCRVAIGMREWGDGIPRRRGGSFGRSPRRRGLIGSRYLVGRRR